MSIKKIGLGIAFAGAILAGCQKGYLDINDNPNSATEENVTPNRALAAQLSSSAARNAGTYDFLQRWMGYWSAAGSYSRSTTEMSYNINNDFGSGVWNGIFYETGQYKSIENKSAALGWTYYQGIARAMKAFDFSILVDFYNNVPYSKALDLAGNIRPEYDNGEDIYKGVMQELDSAMALIKGADINVNTDIATQDIMFKGVKTSWYKFINTVKLRLLIHTSQTSTFDVATEIGKITAEGSGFLGAGASAQIQPGYTSDRPNPFYSAHMRNAAGQESDNYNRANKVTLDLMLSLNDDTRIKYMYRPCKAFETGADSVLRRGTIYGSDPDTDLGSDRTSGAGTGIGKSATGPMWLMTSVESLFLQAEAIARGWIPGTPQTAYEAAVKESFAWLNAPASAATAYLGGVDDKVLWPANPTLPNMLYVIAWQKYFALNGIQANETWVDVRRLGIVQPPLSIAPERGGNPIPVRLLYPSSEYSYNKGAVNAQGTISQFTSPVFWDK